MEKIIELLPLLIPLIIAELAVLGYSLYYTFCVQKRKPRSLDSRYRCSYEYLYRPYSLLSSR